MSLSERVKQLALSNDVDYVGIAPVDRFKYAPRGHKPADLLPGAESVISMGIRISHGPELTQRLALADLSDHRLRHVAFSYRWFGYGLLNQYFLDRAAFIVTRLIEREGEIALPIVASAVESYGAGALSNRHAAVAAGLGEFGWNQLCVTPDAGPRVRFVSVITTARLNPDPMYRGPKICEPEKCRELGNGLPVCVRACPINNLSSKKSLKLTIGDREFEYVWHNHNRCPTTASGGHPLVLGPQNFTIPKTASARAIHELVAANMPSEYKLQSLVFKRAHFCGMCLVSCPVGSHKLVNDMVKKRGGI